ncbi:MAG: carboxypeptidase regulatory-like domain-containing protein [Bacteroidia bacterium]|nr:carboxypeptidase regulatory-like domain-containing protein [Bacteroidia bacterium]
MTQKLLQTILGLVTFLVIGSAVYGQGVTTAAMNGRVTDAGGKGLEGATIVATHGPSGSVYGAIAREEGYFNLPGLRVGGPYRVRISFLGYGTQEQNEIYLGLGQSFQLTFSLQEESVSTEEVEITASRSEVKNGAATNISNQAIGTLPTLSRRVSDFTRLTPQANGSSFGGQDNRLNNITLDGSVFNSSFGLGSAPGDRTGVSPISLDAIDQVQVSLAPYDVRQAGFVGAGINAVTRSGTNEVSASVYHMLRNQNFLGDSARGQFVPRGNFNYFQSGLRVGGPIIKNKLFFFISGEIERNSSPATTFTPNDGTQQVGGSVSRVLKSDLDDLSSFLLDNFGYETGAYEGYNLDTKADKFLAKFDLNLNEKNKLSVRYNYLKSSQDVLLSNSSSLGFGNRQPNLERFSYQNSNYSINENIQSVVAELNSNLGDRLSNNLIIGYTYQDEDRGDFEGDPTDTKPTFPLVEIQDNGSTYISVGYEPFTPSNQLSYSTFQISDNLTYYANAHKITAGFNLERFSFKNVFFPGSQSVYVYQSLSDFYADADGDASTVMDTSLRRFQLRYSALEGGAEPVQPSKVTYTGLYIQDEWQVSSQFNLTYGVRVDIPFFQNTGYENTAVNDLSFLDPEGETVKFSTSKLPDPNPLISPRVGFSYNVQEDGSTRVRGGSGIFTGRPAFVWISNQIGNNGVLTGFIQSDNTTNYPFSADPTTYIPANPSLPSSYELALTDPKFRFPQVWRSNLAVEQKLPLGLVGTVEFLYNRDVNAVSYYNANLPEAQSAFVGPDTRPRYTDNRANDQISSAVVLSNTGQGSAYSLTFQVERPFKDGFYGKLAYNFGEAKNIINAGSIASGTWFNNPIGGDPNNPLLAFANDDQRHRVIGALSYRIEYGNIGATQFGIVYEGRTQGRTNFVYSGDMNGDGGTANDLIYIPNSASELNWQEYTSSGTTFTIAMQEAAFDAYMEQDPYLSAHKGQIMERNGLLLPWLNRMDLSFVQEFFVNAGGKRNTLQFRADVINFTNLLNSDWGVSQSVINARPVIPRGVNAENEPIFRFANLGSNLLSSTYRYNNSLTDIWQLQVGIRYIFN